MKIKLKPKIREISALAKPTSSILDEKQKI
jgi:hypothetical protein